MLADLVEEPGVADNTAANHQSARTRYIKDFLRLCGGIDIPVREDGTWQRLDGAGDVIVMHFGAVHLFYRAAMNSQQVERVSRKNRQQFVKDIGRIKTDARLDREFD